MDGNTPRKGRIILTNGAREPKVGDVATCRVAKGVRMGGVCNDKLTIYGVDRLRDVVDPIAGPD